MSDVYVTDAVLFRYGCDVKVVRLLRERSLGNSVTQVCNKLREQHQERYLERALQYMTACRHFEHLQPAGTSLHCRCRTHGTETTTNLIDQLIESHRGNNGLDMLEMTIFDQPLMDKIWSEEKKHIPCILDPEGVQLYVQTGTWRRGGAELKTYHCARNSVSLESFHLHITRFIPGLTTVLFYCLFLYTATQKVLFQSCGILIFPQS